LKQIELGDRGEEVKLLQQRLTLKGFQPGRIDGVFGPATEDAVVQFQAGQGLIADGIVGARTWAALLAGPEVEVPEGLTTREGMALAAKIPMRTPDDVTRVLLAALRTLGWREQPDGSNDGPEVGKISGGWMGAGEPKPPWCALAVSYWLREGLKKTSYDQIPFGKRLGSVYQIEAWAKAGGRIFRPDEFPLDPAGAIFTMGRAGSGSDLTSSVSAGHTGLVLCRQGDLLVTIEGNTGNAVKSLTRRPSTLRGLVKWW
jgi:hypothetical protein